jgi:UDP-N-acetylmuramoyl-L-alanyl-D-glutamate--2,6-diaminopimelate ligase
MSRSLQEVVDALARAGLLIDAPDGPLPEITGLSADARKIERGMLFCAVRGAVQDGHHFIGDALGRGAAAALVEARQSAVTIPQVLVRNGRRAAAAAAEAWYQRPAARLQMIGVTGTNGKTTSVILARHVLGALWPMGSIGTLGCLDPSGAPVESEAGNLTTPGPIDLQATLAALVARGAQGVAMEVSSHSLDQGRVDGLVFRAAIFTNLTRDHLDYHETFEAYFAAKAKLMGYLADAGLAVVNADDAAWARLPRSPRRITFSATGSKADVTARDVRVDAKGARFTLVTTNGSYPVALPLLGRFNVANALGVAACAVGLDVPPRTVAERLSSAPQVPGRMERIAVDPCVVLRDYAHTPDALERALETVREVTSSGGRVIVVFGAGGDRDRGKRAPMGEIAVRLADIAIATSDNPRTEDPERILDDVEAGMGGRQHYRVVDRRAAIGQALELAREGDTILLAGKGHETYQVIGTKKEPFDEREVVRGLGAD